MISRDYWCILVAFSQFWGKIIIIEPLHETILTALTLVDFRAFATLLGHFRLHDSKVILDTKKCQKVISGPHRFLYHLKHEKCNFLEKGSLTISATCLFHPPMGYPYWLGGSGFWVLTSQYFDLCLDVENMLKKLSNPVKARGWFRPDVRRLSFWSTKSTKTAENGSN